jgi:hypothetical protein
MAQARPEIQTRVRLDLGKVHLELMYYVDENKNMQLAIEHFEWVLERSKEKEDLVEALNYKTQALLWKLATCPVPSFFDENQEFPLRTWAKGVATAYKNDATAVCYYAISSIWKTRDKSDDLALFELAWHLLRAKHQAPPPGFHYFYFLYSQYYCVFYARENKFRYLALLMSALEHLALFAESVTLKEVHIIQWYVAILASKILLTYSIGTKGRLSQFRRFFPNSS